jgi:DNA-binding FadR family transcriptional regulator
MVAQADSLHFGRIASLYLHMSSATYQDVMDARMTMEPVVAGLVAERQDPAHLATLREYLERSKVNRPWSPVDTRPQVPVADESEAEDAASSAGFHTMLLGMSGNPVIDLLARSMQDLLLDRLAGTGLEPEWRPRVEEIHQLIAKAIISGRAAEAEKLMREHMSDYARLVRKANSAILDETVYWH